MKGDNIADRLLAFAAQVLRIISRLDRSTSATHIAKQLTRAATAGGANYEEARGAESRADFIHKIKGCVPVVVENESGVTSGC